MILSAKAPLPTLCLFFLCLTALAPAQSLPVVIRTSTVLDGKGHVLHDLRIVVEDGKIARIEQESGSGAPRAAYDLRGLTVMPGLIDAHVHITWHFGLNRRIEDRNETPAQAALGAEGNAWATLMAGFTTVQSVGSPADGDLRDAIAGGGVPGPRILTSLQPITGETGAPEAMRQAVRQLKANGADLVKIFASKSIREGGAPTLDAAQLEAACGEAKKVGLRTLVHAYRDSVRTATLAGCAQIEHGTYASDRDLELMAQRGTYFDPQTWLVIRNYLDNKSKFLGIGNYTEEAFAVMEKALPLNLDLFQRALKTRSLKVVLGTDAVAGAHGRNAEELIYRIRQGGQPPMPAIISATSLAAESLGLQNEIGSIAAGMQADIIAVEGNPLEDIEALRRVVFVMKNGTVYKNAAAAYRP